MSKTVWDSLKRFSNSFTVSIPILSFIQSSLSSTHQHLFNQVEYTCDLFKYIPRTPLLVSFAKICSIMGSEEFYCFVIPVMTWCLASYKLCAATVLLLCANLWVGNSCKNTFCLPRPPLKYRYNTFEEKGLKDRKLAVDALGFGWPSTHSSNAVSLPFAVLRTLYGTLWQPIETITPSMIVCYSVAFFYAIAVPLSRLVLGVHSAADVHAGMLYGCIHLRLWVVYHDEVSSFLNEASTAMIILSGLLLCALHPRVHPQNYTHEESVCIVAFTMGFLLGKQLSDEHNITNSILSPPSALLPHYFLRVIIGFAVVLPSKEIIKKQTAFMRTTQLAKKKNLDEYNFAIGDFVSKLLQYCVGYGMGVTFFAPLVFKLLGI